MRKTLKLGSIILILITILFACENNLSQENQLLWNNIENRIEDGYESWGELVIWAREHDITVVYHEENNYITNEKFEMIQTYGIIGNFIEAYPTLTLSADDYQTVQLAINFDKVSYNQYIYELLNIEQDDIEKFINFIESDSLIKLTNYISHIEIELPSELENYLINSWSIDYVVDLDYINNHLIISTDVTPINNTINDNVVSTIPQEYIRKVYNFISNNSSDNPLVLKNNQQFISDAIEDKLNLSSSVSLNVAGAFHTNSPQLFSGSMQILLNVNALSDGTRTFDAYYQIIIDNLVVVIADQIQLTQHTINTFYTLFNNNSKINPIIIPSGHSLESYFLSLVPNQPKLYVELRNRMNEDTLEWILPSSGFLEGEVVLWSNFTSVDYRTGYDDRYTFTPGGLYLLFE